MRRVIHRQRSGGVTQFVIPRHHEDPDRHDNALRIAWIGQGDAD
jgi:hypothetical protein